MEWDLLEKTTFRVQGAVLKGANLGDVAAAAASALGLETDQGDRVDKFLSGNEAIARWTISWPTPAPIPYSPTAN